MTKTGSHLGMPKFDPFTVKVTVLFTILLILLSSLTVLVVEQDDVRIEDTTSGPDPVPQTPGHGSPYPTNFTSTQAGTQSVLDNDTTFMKEVTRSELERVVELENTQEFVNTDQEMYDSYMRNTYLGEEDAVAEGDGAEREVEEADIVKVVGDHLFVLNPYRGLLIIDLSEPSLPTVIGRAPVFGYPIEMYVVDSLAFVVLNTNYDFWYNYWMFWDTAEDMIPVYQIGSQIMIIDISDHTAPEVIQKIDLEGFVSNTRRVGEVLYAVSNCYAWYNNHLGGVENVITDETYIASINIQDPEHVFEVERVHFPGSSNEIHVTSQAIFVAQPFYFRQDSSWVRQTNITYVDIDDPAGDITVLDTFIAEGLLYDRYQMDYFEGTFRVVTHFWQGIGESELRIFDVSDPTDVTLLGKLLIDDAGSLMATRFAGLRGYTIHLPRSVDPLDVLDLSDPTNPRLTDILEMPGWVTHMEVRGYKIIALGVDDSSGKQKVAVSLFDVSDPENAVLQDRVSVGEGMSWSGANWDPKALTVLDEEGMVLVPFTARIESQVDGKYNYDYVDGVQIVDFDLEAGELTARGTVEQKTQVTRTRMVGDNVVATSSWELQVMDISDRDEPEIIGTFEFTSNIIDVIEFGEYAFQLVQTGWREPMLIRTVPVGGLDSGAVISEVEVQAGYGKIAVQGNRIIFTGYDYDTSETFVEIIDANDPLAIESMGRFTLPEGTYNDLYQYSISNSWYYGYYGYYSTNQYTSHIDRGNPHILDDDHLVFVRYSDSKDPDHTEEQLQREVASDYSVRSSMQHYTVMVVNTENGSAPYIEGEVSYWAHWSSDFKLRNGILHFTESVRLWKIIDDVITYPYTNTMNFLGRVDLTDPADPMLLPYVNIPGTFLDVGDDNAIYTVSSWWNDGSQSIQTFNILTLDENTATLRSAILINETIRGVQVLDGIAYLSTSNWSNYGWYWCDYVVQRWNGYYSSPGDHTLMMIDVSDVDDPTLLNEIQTSGTGNLVMVQDGYAFIQMGMSTGILVYDVDDPQDPVLLGLYLTASGVQQIRMEDDHVNLIMGLYGVTSIPLSRD